ncbi:uncharacterized protein K444DRAFT_630064 [Hyaloscypha bicolor E]|uniref:Uncharacterized protein n=1 Tax=Hyaloscypha bicolor E TaxID=1095630 RepID=A0A2J6T9G2_9HELO|nr:uncharacterized protein K444DRAFT_630064 [Hyaloscypha bicolor E]PMD59666.1 hypothetical protein K444DRAFT_630064 [Hyaloscypha bicolor E]
MFAEQSVAPPLHEPPLRNPSNANKPNSSGPRNRVPPRKKSIAVKGAKPQGISKSRLEETNRSKRSKPLLGKSAFTTASNNGKTLKSIFGDPNIPKCAWGLGGVTDIQLLENESRAGDKTYIRGPDKVIGSLGQWRRAHAAWAILQGAEQCTNNEFAGSASGRNGNKLPSRWRCDAPQTYTGMLRVSPNPKTPLSTA